MPFSKLGLAPSLCAPLARLGTKIPRRSRPQPSHTSSAAPIYWRVPKRAREKPPHLACP